MENFRKAVFAVTLGLVLILPAQWVHGQTPFKGGQGDGFDNEYVSLTLSLNETLQKLDFSVFPNPVKSGQILRIKFSGKLNDQKYRISMLNIIGSRLFEREFTANQTLALDLQDQRLKPGIYFIEVRRGNQVTRKRINVVE